MIYKNGHADPTVTIDRAVDSYPTTCPNCCADRLFYLMGAFHQILDGIQVFTDKKIRFN